MNETEGMLERSAPVFRCTVCSTYQWGPSCACGIDTARQCTATDRGAEQWRGLVNQIGATDVIDSDVLRPDQWQCPACRVIYDTPPDLVHRCYRDAEAQALEYFRSEHIAATLALGLEFHPYKSAGQSLADGINRLYETLSRAEAEADARVRQREDLLYRAARVISDYGEHAHGMLLDEIQTALGVDLWHSFREDDYNEEHSR